MRRCWILSSLAALRTPAARTMAAQSLSSCRSSRQLVRQVLRAQEWVHTRDCIPETQAVPTWAAARPHTEYVSHTLCVPVATQPDGRAANLDAEAMAVTCLQLALASWTTLLDLLECPAQAVNCAATALSRRCICRRKPCGAQPARPCTRCAQA